MSMHETMVGSRNYNVLRSILIHCNTIQNNLGAEVGVLEADTSCYLLTEIPTLTLICVDPWVAYDSFEPERTGENMRRARETALTRLSKFGSRAKVMETFSKEAAEKITEESLDFVFIDAIHSYEAVVNDLEAWFPKVRLGGIVAGHDYRWTGVEQAVQEFSVKSGLPGCFTPPSSDIWFFVRE